MSSAKDFKKKIRSVSNTKKITRTMEMVATVKSKQAQDRIKATTPYSQKLAEILASLAASGSISHPFLTTPAAPKKSLVLVVTANRGLCGGYNANVLYEAEAWLDEERQAGRETEIHMIGKKGISRFRFRRVEVARSYTHIGDRPAFKDADDLAEELMRRFLAGDLKRVMVFATKYHSSSLQKPARFQLLPISPPQSPGEGASGAGASGGSAGARAVGAVGTGPAGRAARAATLEFIFEPDRDSILRALLPLSVKNALYRILVEASASEQIARRVAMKLATDNAEEMIKHYTRRYNRQRQAGITQQIMEIVAGAEALE